MVRQKFPGLTLTTHNKRKFDRSSFVGDDGIKALITQKMDPDRDIFFVSGMCSVNGEKCSSGLNIVIIRGNNCADFYGRLIEGKQLCYGCYYWNGIKLKDAKKIIETLRNPDSFINPKPRKSRKRTIEIFDRFSDLDHS